MQHERLTVILPTRNEEAGIRQFIMGDLVPNVPAGSTVLFVDDSRDNTPRVIEQTARELGSLMDINLMHRQPCEQKGLATAIVAGIEAAQTPLIAVMDADGQHPAKILPQLLYEAKKDRADFVVASRYIRGGSTVGLGSPYRKLVSRATGELARVLFPKIRAVSDPMSGFFLARKDMLQETDIAPRGFKILLHYLVMAPWQTLREVPYAFAKRCAGVSNADLKQGTQYLLQLYQLYTWYAAKNTTSRA